jgi:inosine-uridine nucleoside N-ribohydrolase
MLGITTVTGEAEKRASLASVLCRAAGKDIPIYPGADRPMHGKQRQPVAQQAAALPRWPHQMDFPKGQAVDFMAEIIRSHPGEVTLLTIGPMTNAGILFSEHRDVAKLLAGLVMMGGSFDEAGPEQGQIEWNVACDLAASEITYKAPVRLHRSLGLDVTQKVMMSLEAVRKKFTTPLLLPVLDMAEIWFAGFRPFITCHDPLAAATIFEPDLCSYQQGTVQLDKTEKPGRTIWQPGGRDAPHQVAVTVDVDRYFEHFFHVVGTGP